MCAVKLFTDDTHGREDDSQVMHHGIKIFKEDNSMVTAGVTAAVAILSLLAVNLGINAGA